MLRCGLHQGPIRAIAVMISTGLRRTGRGLAILSCVITHRTLSSRSARIALRTGIATALVMLVGTAGTAYADTPASWADAPEHGAFDYLLLLLLIPAGLAVIITLLTVLPSLIHGESHEKGDAWRTEEEWFGGPRDGLQTSDREGTEAGKGGASGNW